MKKHLGKIIVAAFILAFLVCCIITTPISEAVGSLWSLLPPIAAIGLALITKEVYSSLFIGCLTGAVIYAASASTGIEGVFKALGRALSAAVAVVERAKNEIPSTKGMLG